MANQPHSSTAIISPQYCAPATHPVDLIITKETTLRDSFTVTDTNNNVVFTVKSSLVTIVTSHEHRFLCDANGNSILHLRRSLTATNDTWKAFRGESEEPKDLIFTRKLSSLIQLRTKLNVFLANNSTQDCDFTVKANLYKPATCPFIEREFRCEANGRPDLIYTHYRWKPLSCNLLRFDGEDFLERMRGKSIMFVGDSLSRNQWQSMTCLLHSAVPNSNYTVARVGDVSIFTFTEYEVKVMLDRNVYLVDVVREDIGRVLKLDSIEGSKLWNGVDMLIFNTWHWWYRRGPTQPWDYIQVGGEVMKDMDRMKAFERALITWAAWVDANIDPTKVKVFFQGISPSHYNGTLWNEPTAKSCIREKTPVPGSTYPGGLPPAVGVLKSVLSTIKKPVTLLDITTLSLLRKDGHPSIYGLFGLKGMDCSHWCLSGVPDTWNEILYNLI